MYLLLYFLVWCRYPGTVTEGVSKPPRILSAYVDAILKACHRDIKVLPCPVLPYPATPYPPPSLYLLRTALSPSLYCCRWLPAVPRTGSALVWLLG
jgi:hypothetical protein